MESFCPARVSRPLLWPLVPSPSRCASDRLTCPLRIGQARDGGMLDDQISLLLHLLRYVPILQEKMHWSSARLYPVMLVPLASPGFRLFAADWTGSKHGRLSITKTSGRTKSARASSLIAILSAPLLGVSTTPRIPARYPLMYPLRRGSGLVSIFGIVPLLLNPAVLAMILDDIPSYRAITAKLAERRQETCQRQLSLFLIKDLKKLMLSPRRKCWLILKGLTTKDIQMQIPTKVPLLDAKGANKF
ncbi:hypothetical protein BDN71DRAFT_1436418 [Pleurotus eryngii]|uniref:Uncharacterized protein n=1 Tax=Pleurotus eryngii TaxID=5323 RepID=A0A9P5ZJ54_PLEER|nr:hypothetical protein BDN71DRAFT_1436418 [Pleurotus eryngii]